MKIPFVASLLIVGLATLCVSQSPAQQKPNKSKTKVLKEKLSTVQKKKQQVRGKLKAVKTQVWIAASDIDQIDGKIKSVEGKLTSTKKNLAKAKVQQEKLEKDLNVAHAKLLEKRNIAARRIRSMYVSGNSTILSVLIGSSDVADFASRKALLERIAKRDHDLFMTVRTLRDEIRTKKKKQDTIVNHVAELKAQQQMQEQDLRGARVTKQKTLNVLREQRQDLEEELEAMERESSRIESQIRAFQATNAGRVTAYKGRFMLPVSGRFSSPYGYRVHPISHVRKLHTGQDIAAPMGTTIRAAGPGVVISTGRRGGYGNTVIIDHGGGISTLYGHCSRIFARAGQKVSAGDSIAAVGTTGYSTGPHLHFEVRVNGSPVNPRPYIGG